jgi:hypothetical protein
LPVFSQCFSFSSLYGVQIYVAHRCFFLWFLLHIVFAILLSYLFIYQSCCRHMWRNFRRTNERTLGVFDSSIFLCHIES